MFSRQRKVSSQGQRRRFRSPVQLSATPEGSVLLLKFRAQKRKLCPLEVSLQRSLLDNGAIDFMPHGGIPLHASLPKERAGLVRPLTDAMYSARCFTRKCIFILSNNCQSQPPILRPHALVKSRNLDLIFLNILWPLLATTVSNKGHLVCLAPAGWMLLF